MGYTPIAWEDAPSTATPINAANLNHMEQGIIEAGKSSVVSKTSETAITDAVDGSILDLAIYGKLTQEDGATPMNRKPILAWDGNLQTTDGERISAAELGSVLYGIPVSANGNYTDDNGQQWLCDTLDLNRGVIHRVIGTALPIYRNITKSATYGDFVYSEQTSALTDNNEKLIYHPKFVPVTNVDKTKAENVLKHRCYIENGRFIFRYPAGETLNQDIFNADMQGTVCVYALAAPYDEPLTASAFNQFKQLQTYKNETNLEFGILNPFFELAYAVESDGGEILSEINAKLPFRFGIDADGNYGYIKAGADSVIPFSSGSGLPRFLIKVYNPSDSGATIGVLDLNTMADDEADYQHVATHHFSDLFEITYGNITSTWYTIRFFAPVTLYFKQYGTSQMSVSHYNAGEFTNLFKYNSADGYAIAEFESATPAVNPALSDLYSPISTDPIPDVEDDYFIDQE